MENNIFEELAVHEITKDESGCRLSATGKKVITETFLKIILNGMELITISCLHQQQEELVIGFLYNEGIIDSLQDVKNISFNDEIPAVIVQLKEGIIPGHQYSTKSITSSGGKYHINPLARNQYEAATSKVTFPLDSIMDLMAAFVTKSEIFTTVGGVHSILFYTPDCEILTEDIGRHNCYDKMTGILLKSAKKDLSGRGVVFASGRISSEIMAKIIRIGIPVVVSKSTPTVAAVKLAREHNVTVMGYVRNTGGFIYSCPERLLVS